MNRSLIEPFVMAFPFTRPGFSTQQKNILSLIFICRGFLVNNKAEELLRSLDTSGDGEVNWSEFMAAIEQIESDLYDR